MLDSEYLNDWWKMVTAENPDPVPAEDVKRMLEELSQLRRALHSPDAMMKQLIEAERALVPVAKFFSGMDEQNSAVAGIPKNRVVKTPLTRTTEAAQVAVAAAYREANALNTMALAAAEADA